MKIILAPVDAEMGRGNGQVIVTTRSGTNRFTGAAVLEYTNSGLNPNTWAGNQAGSFKDSSGNACAVQQASSDCTWTLTNKPTWFSNYHPTFSYGGPIIKNKTFFFALWDQQKNFQRTLTTATVLTPTARNGVFRYFDNWNNSNAVANISGNTAGSITGVYPVVDLQGNPVTPAFQSRRRPIYRRTEMLQRIWKYQGGWFRIHRSRLSEWYCTVPDHSGMGRNATARDGQHRIHCEDSQGNAVTQQLRCDH